MKISAVEILPFLERYVLETIDDGAPIPYLCNIVAGMIFEGDVEFSPISNVVLSAAIHEWVAEYVDDETIAKILRMYSENTFEVPLAHYRLPEVTRIYYEAWYRYVISGVEVSGVELKRESVFRIGLLKMLADAGAELELTDAIFKSLGGL